MKVSIISVGKPALSFYRDGIAEYEKRLKRYGGVTLKVIKDSKKREDVERELLAASAGMLRIVLDERGADWTTRQMTDFFRKCERDGGVKGIAFLIGGADGHSEDLRKAGDQVIRLSALTMQHEQALLILIEQIYRVRTIQAGTPYHRS